MNTLTDEREVALCTAQARIDEIRRELDGHLRRVVLSVERLQRAEAELARLLNTPPR